MNNDLLTGFPWRLPSSLTQSASRDTFRSHLAATGQQPDSGKTRTVFISLPDPHDDGRTDEQKMHHALLHFVPGITDAQIADAVEFEMTTAEATRFVAEGWPDEESLAVLRALRADPNDAPQGETDSARPSWLSLMFGDIRAQKQMLTAIMQAQEGWKAPQSTLPPLFTQGAVASPDGLV